MAVAHALNNAPCRIHIYTDSKYVATTLEKIIGGTVPHGRHQDLWNIIWGAKAKLSQVTWVKAHLSEEQAVASGIDRQAWDLNRIADQQATLGVRAHTEDPGAWALYQYRAHQIREWQQHLVKVYTKMRTSGPAKQQVVGFTARRRPLGPVAMPRTQRTDSLWERQHLLIRHPKGTACIRC